MSSVPRPNELDSVDFFHLTMAAHQAQLLHSVTAGGGDAEQVRSQIGEAQHFSGVRYEDEQESRARAAAQLAATHAHPLQPVPAPIDARAGFAEIIRQKKEAEARRAAQTEAAKISNKHKRVGSNAAAAAAVDDSIPPPPPPPPESDAPPTALTYSSSTSRPASKRAAVSAATFAEPDPASPPPPPPPVEVTEEAKLNSLKLARRMFASLDSTSFELEELLPPSVITKLSNIEKKKKDLNTRQEVCSVLKELCVRRSSKTKQREGIFAPRREPDAVDVAAAAASPAVAAPAAAPAAAPVFPSADDSRSSDDDDDDSMVMVCWDANDPMSESRVRLRAGTAHVTQESITATPLLLLDPDADPEMVAAANAAAAMAAGEAMMQRDLLRPIAQRRRSSTPPPPPPPLVDDAVSPVPAVASLAPSTPTAAPVLHSPSGMPALSAKAYALLNGKSLRQQRPLHLLGMLRTNIGYRFLLLHCYREYSEENILCFKALEGFKRHPTAHTLLSIHEKYVRAGSELMINISSRARQVITEFVNAWKVADSAKKQALQEKRRTKEGTWNAQNFQAAMANAAATKRALPVAVLPHTPTAAAAAASSSTSTPVSPTSDLLSQLPFVLDRAHSEILALLERDSFARFLKTPLFQAYLLGASPPLIMKRAQAVDEAEDLELLASVSGAPTVARTRSPHEGGVSPAHNGSKHADPDFRSLLRGKSKGKRPTGIETGSKYTGIAGPNDEPHSAAAGTPSSSPPHTPRDPMCIMDRVRNAFRSSPQPPSPLTPRSGGGNRGRTSPGPAVGAKPVHFVSIGPVAAATTATTATGGTRLAPPPTRTPPPRPSSSNLTPAQRSTAASDATAVHFVVHRPAPITDSKLSQSLSQGKSLRDLRPPALLPMLRTLVGYRFLLAWLYSRREEVPLLAWKATEIFRQFASGRALRSFYNNYLQATAAHPLPIEVVSAEQRDRVAICLHELESSLPLSCDLPDILLEIQSSLLSHLACCHAMFKATPLWASYIHGAGAPMELRRVCDEIASSAAASSVHGSVPRAPVVETPAQRHSRVELIEDVLAECMMLSEHLSPQAVSPMNTPTVNAAGASVASSS